MVRVVLKIQTWFVGSAVEAKVLNEDAVDVLVPYGNRDDPTKYGVIV